MTLLLDSDIQSQVKRHIYGRVGRIGGSVNQLLDYRRLQVEDLNVEDGGFGNVVKFRDIFAPTRAVSVLKRYVRQELSYFRHGARVARGRKTWVRGVHNAATNT